MSTEKQQDQQEKASSIEKEAVSTATSKDEQQKLEQCQIALAEWQGKYTRLSADFENFKKRIIKERSIWDETARADLLIKLLAIVDNFDRAMQHQQEFPEELKTWADGIKMIHQSFKEYLQSSGVKEVPYESFNPEFHEALMQVDSEDHKAGNIVSVMEKGYLLNDRVLRPAKVSVAK